MTSTFRQYAAAVLASACIALPASATTFSIDYTDLWYNAPAESESGWGVNLIQQNEILFVTLFVYGTDGTPRWYVGPSTAATGTGGTAFTGLLYTVNGSYFGAAWGGVTPTQVGEITFNFNSNSTGTMTYRVGSVTVTKNIIRQSFRNDILTGNYIGGTTARGSACTGGILISGELTVIHNHPNINMTVDFVNNQGHLGQCTYAGTYSQAGSIGAIGNGTYNCSINGVNNALAGTYSVTEITNSRNGFNGRYSGPVGDCTTTGFFGGIRDVL